MCYRFIPPLALLFLLLACNGKGKQKEESEEENYAKIEQQEEKTIVKVQVAREDRFNLELVSNGKAEANRKATLNFEVPDVVRQVNVKNGDRVRQGDVIAIVDDVKAKQTLEDAHLGIERLERHGEINASTKRSHIPAIGVHVQHTSLRESSKRLCPRENKSSLQWDHRRPRSKTI